MIELLMAISIMVIVVGALGAVARSVQRGVQYGDGMGTATQHARVVLDRICRTVSEAHASPEFPGFLVVADEVASWRFPDTLVVWHPSGTPVDPEGLPRFGELIVFCPDPDRPERLIELAAPADSRPVPAADDQAAWRREIAKMKSSRRRAVWQLTDRIRTASLSGAPGAARRGVVRFEGRLRPSADQWRQHQQGKRPWDQLDWVQGIYGSRTGLRQAWLRIELQLVTSDAAASPSAPPPAIPFLGSAALYYEMHR